MCAAACYGLGRTDNAKTYLLEVMRNNLPFGYITSIAELAPFFGGLLEQLVEQEFPDIKSCSSTARKSFRNIS